MIMMIVMFCNDKGKGMKRFDALANGKASISAISRIENLL
jgi:hypothetical protein